MKGNDEILIELIKLNGNNIRSQYNFPKLGIDNSIEALMYNHINFRKNKYKDYSHLYISDSLYNQAGYYHIDFIYNDILRFLKIQKVRQKIFIISEIFRIDSENTYLLYSDNMSNGYIGNDLIFLYIYKLYTEYTQYGILFNKPIIITQNYDTIGNSLEVLISVIETNYDYMIEWLTTTPYNTGKDWNNFSRLDREKIDILHNMISLSKKYKSPMIHSSTKDILLRQEMNNRLSSVENAKEHFTTPAYFILNDDKLNYAYRDSIVDYDLINFTVGLRHPIYKFLSLYGREYTVPMDIPELRKLFVKASNIVANKNMSMES